MNTLYSRLQKGLGTTTLVLLKSYPYILIGKLERVSKDNIVILPQSGLPPQLKNLPCRIDIPQITLISPQFDTGTVDTGTVLLSTLHHTTKHKGL